MSSSKFIFLFLNLLASTSFAAEGASLKKSAVNSVTRYELGFGIVQWNETVSLTQGSATTKGFANYAGPALVFNATRYYRSWLVSGMAAASMGQAAAGGFGPSIVFSDSTHRSWSGVIINPSFSYRATGAFAIGLGAMARARFIDWAPSDTSIRVDTRPPLAYGLSLNLHWTLARRLALLQTIAYSGIGSETQWATSAQYVF